jgi:hypothetical protein
MKFATISKVVLVVTALWFATAASAGDTHKGSVQFFGPVQVNGSQLPAGEYQVKWEGSGPNVEMSLVKGSKVLATTPAHMVELEKKPGSDAAIINNGADGSRSLSQIRFAGKKYALSMGTEAAQNQTKSTGESNK